MAEFNFNEEPRCPACGGEIIKAKSNFHHDVLGTCQKCGLVILKNKTKTLAVSFCECPEVRPETEIGYYRPNGRHGILHLECGQIIQIG